MNPQELGQIAEFLVWKELIASGLRLYLPTLDMGNDGAVCRPGGRRFLQIKGTKNLQQENIHVHLTKNEARFADDIVVIAHLDDALQISDLVFVIPIREILASQPLQPDQRTDAYSIEIAWPPRPGHKWFEFGFFKKDLGMAVLPPATLELPATANLPGELQEVDGFRGEAEFVAQLAKSPHLNTFRAFPDMGFCEFLVRSRLTGKAVGAQIKCSRQRMRHEAVGYHIKEATFSGDAADYLFALTIDHDDVIGREALVIPAREIPNLCGNAVDGFYRFQFNPNETQEGLAPFVCSLDTVAGHFEQLLT